MADQNYRKLEKQFYCETCGAHSLASCHINFRLNFPRCAVCGVMNEHWLDGKKLHMYLSKDELLCSSCIDWAVDYFTGWVKS